MATDTLGLIPASLSTLRSTLSILKQYFPNEYGALSESRVQGWVNEALDPNNDRNEDDIRDDIFRYVVGEKGLMSLGATKEQAADIMEGKDEGGINFSDFIEGNAGATTKALPRNSKLVKVGNVYRVIWDLGDGLGWAWYNVDAAHIKQLYKDTTPPVAFSFSNASQFEGRFGNLYFGNAQEISLKAETPWEDLTEKIEAQFGHVPGLDRPEIRTLLRQAYFEGWGENEWVVNYRKTKYYNSLTDSQRSWASMSQSQRDQEVTETATEMAELYNTYWGVDKPVSAFMGAAQKIASGASLLSSWEYDQRIAAQKQEGTPAWQRARQDDRAANEEKNLAGNMSLFAENEWRSWVGPVTMPEEFAERWGALLASGEKSQADLEKYLKGISQSRWAYKPPDVTWADWSAGYKSQIKDELELASIDDKDALLSKVLNSDMTGQDLTQMIRQDNRFLSTQTMHGELSSAVTDMGKRFGFTT